MDISSIQNLIQPKERSVASSVSDGKSSVEAAIVSKVKPSEEALKKVSPDSNVESVTTKELTDKQLSDLNEQLQSFNSYLKFEKDEGSQKMVFFIKNVETNETLRQFPSEEFLAISKNITEYLAGIESTGNKTSPVGLFTSQVV